MRTLCVSCLIVLQACSGSRGPLDASTPVPDAGGDAGGSDAARVIHPDAGADAGDSGPAITWTEPFPALPFDTEEGVIGAADGTPRVFHCTGTTLDEYTIDAGAWTSRTLGSTACTQAVALHDGTAVTLEPSSNGVTLSLHAHPDAGLEFEMPTWGAVAGRTSPVIVITNYDALGLYGLDAGRLELLSTTASPAAVPSIFFGGRAERSSAGVIFAAWSQAKRIVAGRFDGTAWTDLDSAAFGSDFQEYPPGLALTAAGQPLVVTTTVREWSGTSWVSLGSLMIPNVDYVQVPLVVVDTDGSVLVAWRAARASFTTTRAIVSRVAEGTVTVLLDEPGATATSNTPRALWRDSANQLWLAVSERPTTGGGARLRFLRSTPLH